MKACIEHKGRKYYTHNDVTEAFLNGELDDNEFNELFNAVAMLLDGLTIPNPQQKHDYWGDPIVEDKTTIILTRGEGYE